MQLELVIAIIALIASLLSIGGGAITWIAGRPLRGANLSAQELENRQKLSERVLNLENARERDYKLMSALRTSNWEQGTRIRTLETEYAALKSEHDEYKRGVKILIKQLRRHHIDPEWLPPEEKES